MDREELKNEYLKARRGWIESCFSQLNDRQREAVLATEGPVLILAGAGSGKTTVLIQRIANLLRFGNASDSEYVPEYADEPMLEALREGRPEAEAYAKLNPIPAWRILAITFTNKAADELKARLHQSIGPEADEIWACTFHSACVRILRRDAELLGYGSGFNIYDTGDSLSLIKRILKDWNLDEKVYQPHSVLAEISRAKDAKLLPEQYAASADGFVDTRRKRIAELYAEYAKRLFAANAMDFDDLILNTVLLLERSEERRQYWQSRFSHIMVDEYQDTNRLQYQLVSLLSAEHRNLCVVGDDDQSIYRFRGATIENILSFEQQFPGCRTIRLEQNYRSTEQILEAANNVIRNNLGRKGKTLWTSLGRGESVQVYTAGNEYEEASVIVTSLLDDYSRGMKWSDHAILYRMNAQSGQFEFALKRSGIPYRIFGGQRFFDRAEVKDILSYLCVAADPRDELRLTRIINVPVRGIGDKSVETARGIAQREGLPLFEVLEHADAWPELVRPALKMREFAAMIRSLQEKASDSAAVYDSVLEKTGYLTALQQSKDERDEARVENVKELKSSILGYQAESGDTSLSGYLTSIALYTDLDGMDRDEDCVVMMTVHSAKGLEFPVVYVVGMEEGIFPGMRAIGSSDEAEEERRLCYVAFTRAKKRLVLTHARQRMLFGRTTANPVSRFVEESGVEETGQRRRPGTSPFGNSSSSRYGRERPGAAVSASAGIARRTDAARPAEKSSLKPAPEKAPAPLPSLEVGMRVHHQAFGDGTVLKATPMGGDKLLEIGFDEIGSKKLMLKAAARFLTVF